MKFIFLSLLLLCCAFTYDGNQHFTSDGSLGDTQAAINACSNSVYCTVAIPSGAFNWAGTLYQSNLVRLEATGSGRVLTRSATSLTVATGSQTLTVANSGLSTITNNEVVTIERIGGAAGSGGRVGMIGTVTSYSGTTLTVNVTNTFGSGTETVWAVYNQPSTIITNSAPTGTVCVKIYENPNGNSALSGIRFIDGGQGSAICVEIAGLGQPVLIHDCFFLMTGGWDAIGNHSSYGGNSTHGVVWNSSFFATPFSQAPVAIHLKIIAEIGAWTNKSYFGTNDIGGTNNFYVENCDFEAFLNATDDDDESRAVYRYCVFDHAAFGSHGADTSDYGMRHFEFYENTCYFNGYNNLTTMNMNWWFFIRGGTGRIVSNTIPMISSTDYGTKSAVKMIVMNLQRQAGPHPCWGAGTSGGADYPAPRQVGFGRVTGASTSDGFTYNGDSEPIYAWGNTGTGAGSFADSDYGSGNTDSCTGSTYDGTTNYVIVNRDYFTNTADTSWVAYTFPHPLTQGASDPTITIQPQNQTVAVGQTATFRVTATTGDPPLAYQWKKNGVPIVAASNSSYTTPATVCADNGSLWTVLVCNNTNNCILSASATLTVTGCAGTNNLYQSTVGTASIGISTW